jgi:hypothetical protein
MHRINMASGTSSLRCEKKLFLDSVMTLVPSQATPITLLIGIANLFNQFLILHITV